MRWKPPEEWEALLSGIDCPMCQDIHLDENLFSFKVAELKRSFVRLPKNQHYRGWTIVALKRHANELFELESEELAEFWQDVAQVAKAISSIYQPAKINYGVFGNLCPHIHCHLIVRTYDDDPGKPPFMIEREVFLSQNEYEAMIETLQDAIRKADHLAERGSL